MPDGLFVRIAGIPQVRERIGKAKQLRALAAGLSALRTGALKVAGDAKRNCPVDMGPLRASITSQGPFQEGPRAYFQVGTDLKTGPFVEFGTGPAGASSTIPDSANAARMLMGYHYGSRGGWPPSDVIAAWMKRRGISLPSPFPIQMAIRTRGTKAQPFLFPALEKNRNEIVQDVAEAVAGELERG